MRVLAITNMYPTLTAPSNGVFVEQQIRGLSAIGLQVRVVHINRRQEGPFTYFRMAPRIKAALSEFQPDVTHIMYGGVMADRVLRWHHVRPTAVTFHGSDLLGENLSGLARRMISRYGVRCSERAARRADAVIVVARHLATRLAQVRNQAAIQLIPCGIDLERFKPMDRAACQKELGWSAGAFNVLFASSNGDPVKRPWLAEAAVSELKRQGTPAILHYLTGIANAEVPCWLNASDALLLTSLHEGSPTVVKEALGCGLPVVSVKVGDVAERIGNVEGCFLAEAAPVDLAAKLGLVRKRGTRLNGSVALQELSHLHVAHRLRRCYEEMVVAVE
jgi:teichuronic acid biosynthesis glycosyltransferase TuaC